MLKTILAATAGMFGIPRRFPSARPRGSKYMPHIGKKECERAKRCWMQPNYGWHLNGDHASVVKRSAPCMNQLSKRHYQALLAREAALVREAI